MLKVERTGTGFPLVFLHAFPLSRAMWAETHKRLSNHYQVISIDLPGFGESPLIGDIASMKKMATEANLAIKNTVQEHPFVLTGVSMGGYVMFEMLRDIAKSAQLAVFISTKATPDTEVIREGRLKAISMVQKEGSGVLAEKMIPGLLGKTTLEKNPTVVSYVRDQIEKASVESVCSAQRGMATRANSTPFLKKLEMPALVLHGLEDKIIAKSDIMKLVREMKNAEYQGVPNSGHLINLEQPDVFHELFLKFLKKNNI